MIWGAYGWGFAAMSFLQLVARRIGFLLALACVMPATPLLSFPAPTFFRAAGVHVRAAGPPSLPRDRTLDTSKISSTVGKPLIGSFLSPRFSAHAISVGESGSLALLGTGLLGISRLRQRRYAGSSRPRAD